MGLNHKEDMTKQHIVFLTGAGVSSESGLSTFRDKDGIWTKKDAMQFYRRYNLTKHIVCWLNWKSGMMSVS